MKLQKLAGRLARMSWHEISTRRRQETSKRFDVLLHRLNIDPFRATDSDLDSRGRFFCELNDVPLILAVLRRRMPGQVERIVESAGKILDHRFDLLGYTGLDFGREVDWSLDPVHGKRVPLEPWPTIRFLDFHAAGDHKIIWELNRHQWLVTLAKAYRITGEEKYAAELKRLWEDWQRKNPYPSGMNWASTLEVAFRSLSWMWSAFLLEGTPADSPEFQRRMTRELERAAWYIDRYLSTYFSPNTHLLGEGAALFMLASRCPGWRHAARWREIGWNVVTNAAKDMVHSDGFYFEQSTYYHVYALDLLLHARLIGEYNGAAIPPQLDATIRKMASVLSSLSQGGALPRFGDDDGGRVFDGSRTLPEEMSDPLATAAVLYRDPEFKRAAGGIREETLWLLGSSSETIFDSIAPAPPPQRSVAMRASGIYAMLSRGEDPAQLFIDSGQQGALVGHWHAGALSIQLASGGRLWLGDPGTGCYIGPGSRRTKFRGTAAHNTITVDGRDQAEPVGPFSWSALPRIEVARWTTGDAFDLFEGRHPGYTRLAEPVVHRRWVVRLGSECWLVRDRLEGHGVHDLEIRWHFGPGIVAECQGQSVVARQGTEVLALIPASGDSWECAVEMDEYSPVYGKIVNAPVARWRTRSACPVETATILEFGENAAEGVLRRIQQGQGVGYEYIQDGNRRLFCFGDRDEWTVDGWTSDAAFFCFRESTGGAGELLLADGSYVDRGGRRVLQAPGRAMHIECRKAGSEWQVIGEPKPVFNPAAVEFS
jgi:uncharacterized heparinase superfamily protein